MSRRVVPSLLVACALVAAGCGGGDEEQSGDSAARGYAAERGYVPSITGSKAFKVKPGLVPAEFSAAGSTEIDNYVPEGEIVADSGFRPQLDGFAFENYGNDMQPTNLTAISLQNIFGAEAVCLGDSSGDQCVLTPAAQAWMENMNAGMAGGHCEGFSMAALAMYADDLDPADYGAPEPVQLAIRGNDDLQATIAEHFVYQVFPSVLNNQVHGTPMDIVNALIEQLPESNELYTLGIYKPGRVEGHAITPFAIEDKGDNQYAILVYDNNYPGATRAIQVDGNTNEWTYTGGTNPQSVGQAYEGDAETDTLELDPLSPGQEIQPCLFCSRAQAGGKSAKGALLPAGQQYTEITLQGSRSDHPHLIFEDAEGRRTGIVDGEMLQEIPEIEVVATAAIENWRLNPEPQYRIPEGAEYLITIDGSDLQKPARPVINLIGNGLVIEVDDITIDPGQQDRMQVLEGYGLTYESNSEEEIAPNIFAGVTQGESAYVFAASAVGIARGSAISLYVVPEERAVILDSAAARDAKGVKARYILNLTKLTADGEAGAWTKIVRLDGAKGDKVGFEYEETAKPGTPLPLVFVGADGEPTGKVTFIPPDEE